MNYFWITQSPWSQKKELENGWISARPAKKYNHYREMVKTIKKGDLIFFCSRGVINYVGFALASSMSETDKTGEIWKVKIKSSQLEMPIDISNHSEYLLEKRAEKYSPITYLGTAHQGYCSVISKVIAWYLLSRAGVYYKNNSIIELEKSIGYRDTKSVSHRVSKLNALMSSLSRENILDTLDKFGELIYSDYKYQNSTTYDLEYDGVRYPPKVIFGISAITLINRPLFADEFSGGVNSPCFHILEALGFNIVKKNKSSDGNEFEDIDFLINDIEMIENDDSLSVTEREQLIAARKGQGKYRKELIKLYGKCIVTGIPYEFMLRASHIKPWRVSNNKERLDPFNGFLLSSNVDILFDKGFLSFENSGELILCDELKNEFTLRLLGIDLRKKVMIPLGTFQYLDWHRKNIFGRYKGK